MAVEESAIHNRMRGSCVQKSLLFLHKQKTKRNEMYNHLLFKVPAQVAQHVYSREVQKLRKTTSSALIKQQTRQVGGYAS